MQQLKDQKQSQFDETSGIFTHYDLKDDSDHQLLVANHPVRPGESKFYYELEMQERTDKDEKLDAQFTIVAIGMTQNQAAVKNWWPGWPQDGGYKSYGYHSDDGNLFGPQFFGKSLKAFKKCHYGDTIGCGLDVRASTIFYTRNGKLIGAPFTNASGRLFPCVGLRNARLKINFNGPFQYEEMNRPMREPTGLSAAIKNEQIPDAVKQDEDLPVQNRVTEEAQASQGLQEPAKEETPITKDVNQEITA